MNRLYGELRKRFIMENISPLTYNIRFFREYTKKFTEAETYQILNYSSRKFKEYVNFIVILDKQQKLRHNEEVVSQISNIIFNSTRGDYNGLKKIVLETNIINNPDVIEFANIFINIDNPSKTKVIKNIILNNELYDYQRGSLLNLITYVQYTKKDKQLAALEDLLNIPSITSHSYFNKFVNIILKNPNNRYLDDIPEMLENSTLYFNKNILYFINAVLNLKNDNQEILFLNILNNNTMLNSSVIYKTIDFVLNPNNDYKFKYLNYLVNNKSFISDSRFSKLLDLYNEIDEEYKVRALTDIIRGKKGMDIPNLENQITLNSYEFDLITDTIKKCKKEFQIEELMIIVNSVDNVTLDNPHILAFFEGIVNSKYDYQAIAIRKIIKDTKESDILYYNFLENNPLQLNITFADMFFLNHLYDVINLINNTQNKDVCISLDSILKVPGLLIRRDCMDILNKYAKLKKRPQMITFYHILYKLGFLNQNNFEVLDYVKEADDLQAEAIDIVMDKTNLYQDEKGVKLIKYLLKSHDRKIINFITTILLRANILGYEKAEEFIKLVIDNPKDIDNIIQTNLESGVFSLRLVNTYNQLDESNERLIDKAVKVLKRK